MHPENDDHKFLHIMETEMDLQGEGGGGYQNAGMPSPPPTPPQNGDDGGRGDSRCGTAGFSAVNTTAISIIDIPPTMVQHQQQQSPSPMKAIVKSPKPTNPNKRFLERNIFTRKLLYKRLPILNWLPQYNSECAIGDLVAGLTVGLTVIPQALAYANIAGLPPQYGLYGSFLGCFVYIVFGSCKDVPIGPTAITALLTYQTVHGLGPEHAVLLCFLTGTLQLLMGVFSMGFLIDFISGPVSSGFTSAVALIIVTSQIKDVLGIRATGETFLQTWISLVNDVHNTRLWDTVLGVVCIVILLLMRIVAQVQFKNHRILTKTLWLVGTARNAVLVVISGCIGFVLYWKHADSVPLKLIGDVPPGLPEFSLPFFSYAIISDAGHNDTTTSSQRQVSFIEMVSDLGSGIIVVPLVGLLEDIAICKAFANGKSVDATQELLAIGLSNLANSLVQSFPGSGALSRSAVNNSSGVRTPLGGLYTGLLVILALLFLTPYFYYIPKASLAAIIIAAVIFMVEVKVVKPMWRTKKSDLIPGLATFVACLVLPLQYGILIGIGLNILFILYHAARPKIYVETLTSHHGVDYLMLTPDRCLIFPSVDYVRNVVMKHSMRQRVPVVIDCSHIYGADFTAATVIEILIQDFAVRQQPLYFYNLKPSVCAVFEGLVAPKDFHVYYNQADIDRLLINDKTTSYLLKKQQKDKTIEKV